MVALLAIAQELQFLEDVVGTFGNPMPASAGEAKEMIKLASITKAQGLVLHHLKEKKDKVALKLALDGVVKRMEADGIKLSEFHKAIVERVQKALKLQ